MPFSVVSDWVPMGGAARRYRNVKTGEELSRRQYDRTFGALGREGFHSYEEKATLRAHRYKGFYQMRFSSLDRLTARMAELGHRRGYVSAHGQSNWEYRILKGEAVSWASTGAFYLDQRNDEFITEQLAAALETETIDGWVLRWRD